MITDINQLLKSLGQQGAELDYDANRARTRHANTLRELAALGLDRRKQLGDSLANQGLVHSSINLEGQSNLGRALDQQRAESEQSLSDRLSDIARRRISNEHAFNIQSLLPR